MAYTVCSWERKRLVMVGVEVKPEGHWGDRACCPWF